MFYWGGDVTATRFGPFDRDSAGDSDCDCNSAEDCDCDSISTADRDSDDTATRSSARNRDRTATATATAPRSSPTSGFSQHRSKPSLARVPRARRPQAI